MYFPASGIEVSPLIPPLVAFVVSSFTSMGGVSGAFLLLPFQVSVLGFNSPAVSPTNLVFNVVATPSGVYRYLKEGRVVGPLTWVVVAGSLPGVAIGAILRIRLLPDPETFKLFVGLVLLYMGLRLVRDLFARGRRQEALAGDAEKRLGAQSAERSRKDGHDEARVRVKTLAFTSTGISYAFRGEVFSFSTWGILALSFAVGIVGGTYGIGGGAIIAPLLVTLFKLPVYTVAGAALAGTFVTSVFGVLFYQFLVPYCAPSSLSVAPDWLLGLLFGLGGMGGMYCGARLQKFMPAAFVKGMLAVILMGLGAKYVLPCCASHIMGAG